MHDNQHIARLFLLDQGIKQGSLLPRWVDGLGFGYGYPLFNFYPPLVYYLGEFFHLIGFSFIWSIKLVFIFGFLAAAIGTYLFAKKRIGRVSALLSTVLYSYFFYHAVNAYVRGALAEFFSMALIPFMFLALDNLAENKSLINSIWFGVIFALLIICHPLIAFPSIFYIGLFVIYYLLTLKQDKIRFIKQFILACIIGLGLSSFFWLPSLMERKFTLVDDILIKELASYRVHYIYPQQFLYSLWGYGGSIAGPYDGMTFQLGKFHLILSLLALLLSLIFLLKNKIKETVKYFYFFLFLLFFSLFMTTEFSSFIWNNLKYLWYLQFPWRFLTFAGFFLAIIGGCLPFFLFKLLPQNSLSKASIFIFVTATCFFIIIVHQKYFHPQRLLSVTDNQLTTFQEIAWQISRSSFEFVPKGVKTKKSELNATVIDIEKNDLPKKIYEIKFGLAEIKILENKFSRKRFEVIAQSPTFFQLNTFNFPGWTVYLNGKEIDINDNNNYKLITINIPKGKFKLEFLYKDTFIRKAGNAISIISILSLFMIILLTK